MIWKIFDSCMEKISRAAYPKSLDIKNRVLKEFEEFPIDTWKETFHAYEDFKLHHPTKGWYLVQRGFIRNGLAPSHLTHEMCFRDKRELYLMWLKVFRAKCDARRAKKIDDFLQK